MAEKEIIVLECKPDSLKALVYKVCEDSYAHFSIVVGQEVKTERGYELHLLGERPATNEELRAIYDTDLSKVPVLGGKTSVPAGTKVTAVQNPRGAREVGRIEVAQLLNDRDVSMMVASVVEDWAQFDQFIEALRQGILNERLAVQNTANNEPQGTLTDASDRVLSKSEPKPWERIADYGWDRQALELWYKGNTCKEIGKQINVAEKTVRNRLSQLRKTHGNEVIPSDKQRRGKSGR